MLRIVTIGVIRRLLAVGDIALSSAAELVSPGLLPRQYREFACEIKYWIPSALAPSICDWARAHLAADPYGSGEFLDTYCTTSLYFDTSAFDVLHGAGSYGRSKFRVRRYGDSSQAFAERKLKTGSLVSKRRSQISIAELDRLDDRAPDPEWAAFWFHRRLRARALAPVCQINYTRMARMAASSLGPIRLTMDHDIRALPVYRAAYASGAGSLLAAKHVILELKYRYSMPDVFRRLVDAFQLQAQPVSKYRLAAAIPGCVAGVESSL